jgi:hypothetical protein
MKDYKYAVVSWCNYRKGLSARFISAFENLEEARECAYIKAVKDGCLFDRSKIITEDQLPDKNGPESRPYKSIIGYGAVDYGSYATTFFSVVEWFDGVTNYWDEFESDSYWEEKFNGEWYPKYK